MATRSTIAVQHTDGTISQIYCHFDGYLEHNGRLLVDNYNDLELAEELVSLGDMSVLRHSISSSVFYARDRGETETAPTLFASYKDYSKNYLDQDYNYVFKDGQWFVNYCDTDGQFVPLQDQLEALWGTKMIKIQTAKPVKNKWSVTQITDFEQLVEFNRLYPGKVMFLRGMWVSKGYGELIELGDWIVWDEESNDYVGVYTDEAFRQNMILLD